MSHIPPNPHDPPRASWVAPIFLGVLATLLLHSPVLWADLAWIFVCCTLGCSGAPVGVVPALVALRQDPYLGAASGFAVSFIAVGLGAVVLAVFASLSWELDPVVIDNMRTSLLAEGYTEEEIELTIEKLHEVSPFIPVIGAGLMALMGGLAGALAAAIVGRRQPPLPPPGWGPPTPGSGPPPA